MPRPSTAPTLRQEGRGDRQRPRGAAAQVEGDLISRVADEVITGALDEDFSAVRVADRLGNPVEHEHQRGDQQRAIQLVGGTLGSKTPVHRMTTSIWASRQRHLPTASTSPRSPRSRSSCSRRCRHCNRRSKPNQGNGWMWSRPAAPTYRTRTGHRRTGMVGLRPPARPRPSSGSTTPPRAVRTRGRRYRRGTGLNAPAGRCSVAAEIAGLTGYPFTTRTKVLRLGGLDAMVGASAGLRALAVPLMKIANDLRWLASGRAAAWVSCFCRRTSRVARSCRQSQPHSVRSHGHGLHPGSRRGQRCRVRRQPGQLRAQRDASHRHQQLPAFGDILADACEKLRLYCVEGTTLHREQIDQYVDRSLMLVTALSPVSATNKAPPSRTKANEKGNHTPRSRAGHRLHRRRRLRQDRRPRQDGRPARPLDDPPRANGSTHGPAWVKLLDARGRSRVMPPDQARYRAVRYVHMLRGLCTFTAHRRA